MPEMMAGNFFLWLVAIHEILTPEALQENRNHKQTNKKNGKAGWGWKWTESGSTGSSKHDTRWSIDQPLTNTIEILDVMWEASIHNLSASQMWVKWDVDRREHWVLISGRKKKCTVQRGTPKRREEKGKGMKEMQDRDGWAESWGGGGGEMGGCTAQESH